MPETLRKAVLVTTVHRGVFFGYMKDDQGEVVTLRDARNCVYWSADARGFLGLASNGPTETCKIGSKVAELVLRDVTAVAACTDTARDAWEAGPWS